MAATHRRLRGQRQALVAAYRASSTISPGEEVQAGCSARREQVTARLTQILDLGSAPLLRDQGLGLLVPRSMTPLCQVLGVSRRLGDYMYHLKQRHPLWVIWVYQPTRHTTRSVNPPARLHQGLEIKGFMHLVDQEDCSTIHQALPAIHQDPTAPFTRISPLETLHPHQRWVLVCTRLSRHPKGRF